MRMELLLLCFAVFMPTDCVYCIKPGCRPSPAPTPMYFAKLLVKHNHGMHFTVEAFKAHGPCKPRSRSVVPERNSPTALMTISANHPTEVTSLMPLHPPTTNHEAFYSRLADDFFSSLIFCRAVK